MKKIVLIIMVLIMILTFTSENLLADELEKRYEDAFKKELNNAVLMYEKGYDIPKPQLYELGRTYILMGLHSIDKKSLNFGKLTPSECVIMKTVFSILIHNNPPGGADLSKIPSIPGDKYKKDKSSTPWKDSKEGITQSQVEKFLSDNREKFNINDSTVTFLVRAPFAWDAFAERLSNRQPGIDWQDETAKLAKDANTALINAGKAMDNGTADMFATQAPPSIRVYLIENLATKNEPSGERMVNSMLAFKNFGEVYGIYGWKGIVQVFSKDYWKKDNEATLEDFKKFLDDNHVLLTDVKTGEKSSSPLNSVNESILNDLFINSSVFVVY